MSDDKSALADRMQAKAKTRERARRLMRDCMARAEMDIDEEVVIRQAEKIVRRTWPTIKRAWQQ